MPDLQTQAALPMDTQIGADVVVNTWHMFSTAGAPSAEELAAAIGRFHTALQTFYSAIAPALSDSIDHTRVRFKTYDLDLPEPRQPLVDEVKSITAPPPTAGLPHELAICLSFNSEFSSGVNPARRRGRVYIGPLNTSVSAPAAPDPRVQTSTRQLITTAAAALMNAGGAPPIGWFWSTRSKFGSGANQDPAVVGGYVDDAFDIQRRRGTATTARTTFSE